MKWEDFRQSDLAASARAKAEEQRREAVCPTVQPKQALALAREPVKLSGLFAAPPVKTEPWVDSTPTPADRSCPTLAEVKAGGPEVRRRALRWVGTIRKPRSLPARGDPKRYRLWSVS